MAAQANVRPIIIKRKKKGGGEGHHGGAWKVAYADFVTAMMAFFMLMWLLNATTEKQRKGIADYFAPTIAINRISGGGDGAFGGESTFSEQTLPKNGTGATSSNPTEQNKASGTDGEDGKQEEALRSLDEALRGRGGESEVADELLEHIITKVTDEGLVIELIALPEAPLFEQDGETPTPLLNALAILIANASKVVTNSIAIAAHVPAEPVVKEFADVWAKSANQATTMRELLEKARLSKRRVERVSGHADREPTNRNPMDIRNNRLEVIFLRD